jgi:hypothetical protein
LGFQTEVLQPDVLVADPAAPEDGQIWYNGPAGTHRARQNGVTVDIPGSGSAGAVRFVPAFADKARINGLTPALFPLSFLNRWQVKRRSTWDDWYKHLYWEFTPASTLVTSPPQKFATLADMATYLTTIVPMSGGAFDDTLLFRTYEVENIQDPYPMKRHTRNSLVASIKGRQHWLVRFSWWRYGVSNPFNLPAYYINFWQRLGIELVQFYSGLIGPVQTPPTNDDGCVWFTAGKRGGLWNFPRVGNALVVPGGTARGAAWDLVNQAWVSPAPGGYYSFQQPFILYEPYKQRFLVLEESSPASNAMLPLTGPAAMVFPVRFGQYVGFAIYAFGFDTWYTEYLDTAIYEHVVKVKFRHEVSDQVFVVPVSSTDLQSSMFSAFPLLGGQGYFYSLNNNSFNLDSDVVVSKVDICRRHLVTSVKSPWVSLGALRRRLPSAEVRLDPAFRI